MNRLNIERELLEGAIVRNLAIFLKAKSWFLASIASKTPKTRSERLLGAGGGFLPPHPHDVNASAATTPILRKWKLFISI
jgi:hypothetical protein